MQERRNEIRAAAKERARDRRRAARTEQRKERELFLNQNSIDLRETLRRGEAEGMVLALPIGIRALVDSGAVDFEGVDMIIPRQVLESMKGVKVKQTDEWAPPIRVGDGRLAEQRNRVVRITVDDGVRALKAIVTEKLGSSDRWDAILTKRFMTTFQKDYQARFDWELNCMHFALSAGAVLRCWNSASLDATGSLVHLLRPENSPSQAAMTAEQWRDSGEEGQW